MKQRVILLTCLSLAVMSLSSCWLVFAGAGATAGYMARDKGYKAQAPVVKEGEPSDAY